MEERHIFAKDLEVVQGELSELGEHFTRYKHDHKEPEENFKKVHDLAYNMELQLREKNVELAAVKAKIVSLCGQLVHAPAFLDSAFTYGHATNIVKLMTHLLNDLGRDLRALDKCLFNPEIATYRHVNNFGHSEMPVTFVGVPQLPPSSEDSFLTP